MGDPLEVVALDIETTGVTVRDEVTVFGVVLPLGCRVFAQRPPETSVKSDQLAAAVTERADTHVSLSIHESEADLLEAVGAFVTDRLQPDDVLLVAYNGETYRGGFDLPFLRTRLARQGLAWPFTDLPYSDVFPIVRDRFNTTTRTAPSDSSDSENQSEGDVEAAAEGEAESRAALSEVYDVLVGGDAGALDPFADSAAAVTAYERGDLEAVVAHNVADILRTQALAERAQAYCGTSEFSVKSLTPTVEAFADRQRSGSDTQPTGRHGGEADRSG